MMFISIFICKFAPLSGQNQIKGLILGCKGQKAAFRGEIALYGVKIYSTDKSLSLQA